MVKLKGLKMQSFRSFADADIKFPEKGLVLIRGLNPDTGDPSGAGKSSILLAIAYALDILPPEFPATDLQSWGTKVPMQVTLTLDFDGQEVILSRGKKSFLKIGDRTITGSAAIAEEQVKLFGFTPDILKALTFRAQKTPGLFLSLAPAEKVEFLTAVLGLEAIEKAVSAAEKKASDLEVDLKVNAELLQGARAALPQEPVVIDNTPQYRERLQQIQAELQSLDQKYKVRELKDKIVEAETFLEQAKREEADRRRVHEKELAVLHSQVPNFRHAIEACGKANEEIKKLEKRLAHLKDQRCYICHQPWATQSNTDEQELLQKELRMYQLQAASVGHWNEELAKAQKAIKDKVFVSDPKIKKLEEIREHLLQAKLDPEFTKRRHELELQARDVDTQIRVAEVTIRAAAQIKADIARAKQAIATLEAARAEKEAAYNSERDFIALMGREGFLGVIFDDVLREIADEANERLAKMANVTNVRIGFQTEKPTGKGAGKRQINAVVNVNGNQAKFKSGLSGGMQTSVEQQVDLAVITVISRRAGKTIGWLCLDEVFNGVGQVTFETALEVLREFAQDRLVLVIDHASEFKENFSKVIDVVYSNGQSVVQ